jgi:hypothetical protein
VETEERNFRGTLRILFENEKLHDGTLTLFHGISRGGPKTLILDLPCWVWAVWAGCLTGPPGNSIKYDPNVTCEFCHITVRNILCQHELLGNLKSIASLYYRL